MSKIVKGIEADSTGVVISGGGGTGMGALSLNGHKVTVTQYKMSKFQISAVRHRAES